MITTGHIFFCGIHQFQGKQEKNKGKTFSIASFVDENGSFVKSFLSEKSFKNVSRDLAKLGIPLAGRASLTATFDFAFGDNGRIYCDIVELKADEKGK